MKGGSASREPVVGSAAADLRPVGAGLSQEHFAKSAYENAALGIRSLIGINGASLGAFLAFCSQRGVDYALQAAGVRAATLAFGAGLFLAVFAAMFSYVVQYIYAFAVRHSTTKWAFWINWAALGLCFASLISFGVGTWNAAQVIGSLGHRVS